MKREVPREWILRSPDPDAVRELSARHGLSPAASKVLVNRGIVESRDVERFLAGKPWERETVEEAMTHLEQDFTPISDARGSARFRMIAAKNLLLKFWHESQSQGGGAS